MGSKYRKVDPEIWNDERFSEYDEKTKLAWLYLLTNMDCNAIGLYYLSIEKMGTQIGVNTALARRLVAQFEAEKRIAFDQKKSLVWIPRFLRYNPPSGSNQANGYLSLADEFLPHDFAKAFHIIMLPIASSLPGRGGIINKKQAIIIRDNVECVYCGMVLTTYSEVEIDHVIPESKKRENGKYEDLVAACRPCNQKKGDKTAEEFGFPFVGGHNYSIAAGLDRLIYEPKIRERFKALFRGLPKGFENAEIIDRIIGEESASERRYDGVVYPLNRSDDGVLTQEQEQEQEQEIKDTVPPNGNGGPPSLFPSNGSNGHKPKAVKKKKEVILNYKLEWIDEFWQAYPVKQWRVNVNNAFGKINPDRALFDRIMSGLERAKKSEEWARENGKFVPHPAKWLELRGWENVYTERKDAWQYS